MPLGHHCNNSGITCSFMDSFAQVGKRHGTVHALLKRKKNLKRDKKKKNCLCTYWLIPKRSVSFLCPCCLKKSRRTRLATSPLLPRHSSSSSSKIEVCLTWAGSGRKLSMARMAGAQRSTGLHQAMMPLAQVKSMSTWLINKWSCFASINRPQMFHLPTKKRCEDGRPG